MLERLRRDGRVAIWPFETLGDTDAGHLAVEIYPSLIPPAEAAVRDAGQVTAMAAAIAAADADDRLSAMLAEPGRMGAGVVAEEGWILAAGDPAALTAGKFGEQAARSVPAMAPDKRSLSACVWFAHAETSGFDLQHHSVFFSLPRSLYSS